MSIRRTALIIGTILSVCSAGAASGVPYLPAEFGGSAFVITAAGEMYGWGNNNYGQLGIGQAGSVVAMPTLVPRPEGVRRWEAVSDGDMSAGIGDDGNLYLWGRTDCGSSTDLHLTPLLMRKPAGVGHWIYAASGEILCAPLALGDDGNLYQWYFRDLDTALKVPKPEGVTGWRKVTTARSYCLALANNGELFHWAPPIDGEITLNKVTRPEGVSRWVDGSSGMHLELALTDKGEIYQQDYRWPRQPHRLVGRPANVKYWKRISAGYNFSTAIGSDDRLYVWGAQPIPIPFPSSVRKWVSIAAGTSSVLMVGDDCRLYTWSMGPIVGTGTNATYAVAPMVMKGLENLCLPAVPQMAPGSVALAPLHPLFQREREFRFHVLGNVAERFVLLRSPNLRDWKAIFTNAPLTGARTLVDTNVGPARGWFYRVAQP